MDFILVLFGSNSFFFLYYFSSFVTFTLFFYFGSRPGNFSIYSNCLHMVLTVFFFCVSNDYSSYFVFYSDVWDVFSFPIIPL